MRYIFARGMLSGTILCACLAAGEVTNEDLLQDERVASDWLNYHGGYSGHRHSLLDQIDRSNVRSLRLDWAFQEKISEKFEVTPLVHDGIMYITVPPGDVYALDAETGARLWRYSRRLPSKLIACCGLVNRGLAVLGDQLFMATLDAYTIALDRKTGRLLWETEMIDYSLGYSGTHAPLVVKDKVMVGTAGGEYGIRGFIDAFRRRDWRASLALLHGAGPGRVRSRDMGPTIPGRRAGRRSGSPRATTPNSVSSTGEWAIPDRTGTATCAWATTSSRTR